MTIRIFTAAAAWSVLLFTQSSVAQQGRVRTLDWFLERAQMQNAGLRAGAASVKASEARITSAAAWDDPVVGLEFRQIPLDDPNPFTRNMETRISVNQMIPFPGKKSIAADIAAAQTRMSETDLAAARRDVTYAVKRAYVRLARAQRLGEVNQENEALAERILDLTQRLYAVNRASQAHIAMAEVELEKIRNEAIMLKAETKMSASMLDALLNALPNGDTTRVAALKYEGFNVDLASLTDTGLARTPELRGMEYERAMFTLEQTMWERERLPDLMAGAMYMAMRDAPDAYGIMFGVSVPIAPWSSGKYEGRIEENEYRARKAEESLTDMRAMTAQSIRERLLMAESAARQYERYRDGILPQAQNALNANLAGFQTSKTDFLSALESMRMLAMLRMEAEAKLAEYYDALAGLEQAASVRLPWHFE